MMGPKLHGVNLSSIFPPKSFGTLNLIFFVYYNFLLEVVKQLIRRGGMTANFDDFQMLYHKILAFPVQVFGKKEQNLRCTFSHKNSKKEVGQFYSRKYVMKS